MLLVIALAYVLFLVDFDTNPAQVTMLHNEFLVQNKNGKTLWKRKIGTDSHPMTDKQLERDGRLFFLSCVVDLDGDGNSEVLLGHPFGPPGFADSLYCYNSNGLRRWARYVGRPMITLENDYSHKLDFCVWGIAVLPADSTHGPRIVTTADNSYYTNVVNLFDADGKPLAEYVHLGKLLQPTVLWSDEVKKHLVYLAGITNDSLRPVLVALDPDRMSGAGPQHGRYTITWPRLDRAAEVYYVKFPRPALQDILNNEMFSLAHISEPNERQLTLTIGHGFDPENRISPIELIYTFQRDGMLPVSLHTNSRYDTVRDTMMAQGRLPALLPIEHTNDILSRVLYYNGERFVGTPTMNKRYLRE
jgi:hypothetical protein